MRSTHAFGCFVCCAAILLCFQFALVWFQPASVRAPLTSRLRGHAQPNHNNSFTVSTDVHNRAVSETGAGSRGERHTSCRHRIAFIFETYHKESLFLRLFDRIYRPNCHTYVIHIDRNSPTQFHQQVAAHVRERNATHNVVFVDPIPVRYLAFSEYLPVHLALQTIQEQGVQYDHAILALTGSDYPVKSVEYMAEFLAEHPRHIFLGVVSRENDPHSGNWMYRVTTMWVDLWDGKDWIDASRSPLKQSRPPSIQFYKSINGPVLPREFIEGYLLRAPMATRLMLFFSRVREPCEHFLATVVMNSPYKSWVIPDGLKWVKWDRCFNHHNPRSTHPCAFTIRDADYAINSTAFFARKIGPDSIRLSASQLTQAPQVQQASSSSSSQVTSALVVHQGQKRHLLAEATNDAALTKLQAMLDEVDHMVAATTFDRFYNRTLRCPSSNPQAPRQPVSIDEYLGWQRRTVASLDFHEAHQPFHTAVGLPGHWSLPSERPYTWFLENGVARHSDVQDMLRKGRTAHEALQQTLSGNSAGFIVHSRADNDTATA